LLSLLAILLCTFSTLLKIVLIALLTVALFQSIKRASATSITHIIHDSNNDRWYLEADGTALKQGNLITQGYRSALLVVIVIQSDDLSLVHVPIWQDQVSKQAFSYLHYHLKFQTKTAQKASLAAWF